MEHPEEHEDPEVLEYDIETFVYLRRKPFSLDKLKDFVAGNWPEGIIRTKGVIWLADDPNMAYVFEQAGKQVHVQENGLFVASAPEREREMIIRENPEIMDDWDDEVGDRMTKLCIIGRHMNRAAVEAGFDSCLVDWARD
jgi:G3E family GTPase